MNQIHKQTNLLHSCQNLSHIPDTVQEQEQAYPVPEPEEKFLPPASLDKNQPAIFQFSFPCQRIDHISQKAKAGLPSEEGLHAQELHSPYHSRFRPTFAQR